MRDCHLLSPGKRRPKKDQVLLAIREAIFSGHLKPGDQIVERWTAREFGTGVPLLREALFDLRHQGLVQKVPYKGTTVTELGTKEISQMFQLRVELEALAAVYAKQNATLSDIQELQSLISQMQQAEKNCDPGEFYRADLEFHRKIWALSQNSYLSQALERIVNPIFALLMIEYRRESGSLRMSAVLHARIVKALTNTNECDLPALVKMVLCRDAKIAIAIAHAKGDIIARGSLPTAETRTKR